MCEFYESIGSTRNTVVIFVKFSILSKKKARKLHAASDFEIKTVFRYAHQYDRAISLLSSNKIDVKPMITDTVAFDDSIKAFERAAKNLPEDVKIQIQL